MLLSLDKHHLQGVQFDEFVAWHEKFRSPANLAAESASLATQRECEPGSTSIVQQLDFKRSGWGHKALILIDQGYSDQTLIFEASTPAPRTEKKLLESSPGLSLGCAREHLGTDKWLVIYSSKPPVASIAEVNELAEAISKALGDEARCRSRPRVLIGTFSGNYGAAMTPHAVACMLRHGSSIPRRHSRPSPPRYPARGNGGARTFFGDGDYALYATCSPGIARCGPGA